MLLNDPRSLPVEEAWIPKGGALRRTRTLRNLCFLGGKVLELGLIWMDLARLGLARLGLACGLTWLGLALTRGLAWLGLGWLGSWLDWACLGFGPWLGLAWLGLAWLGLDLLGLALLGLACLGFAKASQS